MLEISIVSTIKKRGRIMIKLTFKYFVNYKYLIFFITCFSIITFTLNLFIPYLSGKFIDILVLNANVSIVKKTAIKIFIILICITILKFVTHIFIAVVSINCGARLNFDIVNHLKKVDYLFIKQQSSTYLSKRINSDSNEIIAFVLNNI